MNTLKESKLLCKCKDCKKTTTKKMISFFSALNHIQVKREMRKLSKKKNDAIHSLMNKQIEDFQLPNFISTSFYEHMFGVLENVWSQVELYRTFFMKDMKTYVDKNTMYIPSMV